MADDKSDNANFLASFFQTLNAVAETITTPVSEVVSSAIGDAEDVQDVVESSTPLQEPLQTTRLSVSNIGTLPFMQLPREIQARIAQSVSSGNSSSAIALSGSSAFGRNLVSDTLREIHFRGISLTEIAGWMKKLSGGRVMPNVRLIESSDPNDYINMFIDPAYGRPSPTNASHQAMREFITRQLQPADAFPSAAVWEFLSKNASQLQSIEAPVVLRELYNREPGNLRNLTELRQVHNWLSTAQLLHIRTVTATAVSYWPNSDLATFMPNLTKLTLCYIEGVTRMPPLPPTLTSLIVERYPLNTMGNDHDDASHFYTLADYARILPPGLQTLELTGVLLYDEDPNNVTALARAACFNSLRRLRLSETRYDFMNQPRNVIENDIIVGQAENSYPPALQQLLVDYGRLSPAPFTDGIPASIQLVLCKRYRELPVSLVRIMNSLLRRESPDKSVFNPGVNDYLASLDPIEIETLTRVWDQWFVPLSTRVNQPAANSLLHDEPVISSFYDNNRIEGPEGPLDPPELKAIRAIRAQRANYSIDGPQSYGIDGVANAMSLFSTNDNAALWISILSTAISEVQQEVEIEQNATSHYEYRETILQYIGLYSTWLYETFIVPILDLVLEFLKPGENYDQNNARVLYGIMSQSLANYQVDQSIGPPRSNTVIEWTNASSVPMHIRQ